MREATRTTPATLPLGAAPRLALIFLGGAAGALLRTVLLFPVAGSNPAAEAALLLGINVIGALLLGALVTGVTAVTSRADATRALLGTGVLGGFTSYSSLVLLMFPAGGAWPAGLWLALASVIAGLGAAYLGIRLGETVRFRITSRPASGV